MKKELIICVVVILSIITLNAITSNYTKKCKNELTSDLEEIKNEIKNTDENNKIIENVNNLKQKWQEKYEKLAYYIEHDELEKVYLYIEGAKSGIETEEYTQAIEEIDKCVYILEHIEEKYRFNLKNIF
jgi:uncharacterized membrane protein YgaE (UPF0421/DUF939 family)